jgi:hypothetical protein
MGKVKQCSKNNSIKLFIIYVPSQQLLGKLQTQHTVYIIIIIIIIITIIIIQSQNSFQLKCSNNNDNSIQFNPLLFMC